MKGLEHDEDSDEEEQHGVDIGRQRLCSAVARGEGSVGREGGRVRGEETDQEREAVEEHVARVGNEAQRVSREAHSDLDKHERKVQAEEKSQAERRAIADDVLGQPAGVGPQGRREPHGADGGSSPTTPLVLLSLFHGRASHHHLRRCQERTL